MPNRIIPQKPSAPLARESLVKFGPQPPDPKVAPTPAILNWIENPKSIVGWPEFAAVAQRKLGPFRYGQLFVRGVCVTGTFLGRIAQEIRVNVIIAGMMTTVYEGTTGANNRAPGSYLYTFPEGEVPDEIIVYGRMTGWITPSPGLVSTIAVSGRFYS